MNNQLDLALEPSKTRGGKRCGAGRKRRRSRPGVPHDRRQEHKARHPVHVTYRIADCVLQGAGLRTLRRRDVYKIIRRAFVHGCKKDTPGGNFRICRHSSTEAIQRDHMHLLVEADSREALSQGMQGFAIRVAKGINRFLCRRGKVFDDRYHAQPVTSPRQTRNALSYVILNARKHGEHKHVRLHWSVTYVDPYSSAHYFDGFTQDIGPPAGDWDANAPVAAAQTWLLCVGWRRHGLIPPDHTPGQGARAAAAGR